MEDLQKEFIPYDRALKMKTLGFDEPCCAFYQVEYAESRPTMVDDDSQYRLTGYRTCKNSEIPEHYTSAPTFSQAFRWFREKYGLFIRPAAISYEDGPYLWFFEINSTTLPFGTDLGETDDFTTYEEAELACLEKLIEIVESKSE